MRRSRIYCEQGIDSTQSFALDDRNCHYLIHVLRVKAGQSLVLFDGKGNDYLATIDEVKRKSVIVSVQEQADPAQIVQESPLAITLGIAVSKGERMDWVMQKATELGVTAIQPLSTQRVDVKLNQERMAKRHDHWRGVIIGACEQSGRPVLPKLANILTLEQWLAKEKHELQLVLRANGSSFSALASQHDVAPRNVSVLIGPEGGLSAEELLQAERAGFLATGFGPRVLRTETAPIVALALLQAQWGDF